LLVPTEILPSRAKLTPRKYPNSHDCKLPLTASLTALRDCAQGLLRFRPRSADRHDTVRELFELGETLINECAYFPLLFATGVLCWRTSTSSPLRNGRVLSSPIGGRGYLLNTHPLPNSKMWQPPSFDIEQDNSNIMHVRFQATPIRLGKGLRTLSDRRRGQPGNRPWQWLTWSGRPPLRIYGSHAITEKNSCLAEPYLKSKAA
jgi:hypothetical protein